MAGDLYSAVGFTYATPTPSDKKEEEEEEEGEGKATSEPMQQKENDQKDHERDQNKRQPSEEEPYSCPFEVPPGTIMVCCVYCCRYTALLCIQTNTNIIVIS